MTERDAEAHRRTMAAFGAVLVALMLGALDITIVGTAIPRIVNDLDGSEHLAWVVTSYLLASTVTIPIYGKLSDIYGRKRLFTVAIVVFVIGSVLCGAAQSMLALVIFRAVQGLGAGGLIPLAQAAVGDLFSPRERGRYQGYLSAVWGFAAIAGPLVGGTITDAAGWRWIFWLNVPLGIIALVVVIRTLPDHLVRRAHKIDVAGALVFCVAISSALLALTWGGTTYPWLSVQVLGTAVVGIVGLAAFIAIERAAAEPIVPLRLLANRVLRVTAPGAMIMGASAFALGVYGALYFQSVQHLSAASSGLALMGANMTWIGATLLTGQTMSRTGRYRLFPIVGMAVLAGGMLWAAQLDADTPVGEAVVAFTVIGLGIGLISQVIMAVSQNAAAYGELGVATALTQFSRMAGGAIAVAAFGAILQLRLGTELERLLGDAASSVDRGRLVDGGAGSPILADAVAASLHTVFLVGACLAAVGFFLMLRLEARPLRETRYGGTDFDPDPGPEQRDAERPVAAGAR